jgi:hypothetical protein
MFLACTARASGVGIACASGVGIACDVLLRLVELTLHEARQRLHAVEDGLHTVTEKVQREASVKVSH